MFDDHDHCPTAHCWSAVACICTLYPTPSPWLPCTKPETTQDGNVTVPIVGGAGSEEKESTKPDITEGGNATIPFVGEVGGDERDSGVAAAVSQDDEGVVQHRVTATLEELTSYESFFGEKESVMMIASSAHESASTTQGDDDDSTHGEKLSFCFSTAFRSSCRT